MTAPSRRDRNTRRDFLTSGMSVAAGAALSPLWPDGASAALRPTRRPRLPAFPDGRIGWRGESSVAAALRASGKAWSTSTQAKLPTSVAVAQLPDLPDLHRRFIFEYYAWYGAGPDYRHWSQWDRRPPVDLATTSVPRLGAYGSGDLDTLETHARWIADAGAGAINLSWWGVESDEEQRVHRIMDVMHDHDLKVTFHLEPYATDRGDRFVEDVLYLLREYGDGRGWDAFLLLRDPSGAEAPVFKGFRTILPPEVTDCHGDVLSVPDYTSDDVWARQTDTLRDAVRGDFDHITLLADSLDVLRSRWSGFDGLAVYDNFVSPESYAEHALRASEQGLLFSFNANPGFDAVEPRFVEPGSCYVEQPFAPPGRAIPWETPGGREQGASRAREQIRHSLATSVAVQTDPSLLNAQRGFFLVYLNSFNEWHEGHAFEPMKDWDALTAEERALPYHNPSEGDYRMAELSLQLGRLFKSAWTTDTSRPPARC